MGTLASSSRVIHWDQQAYLLRARYSHHMQKGNLKADFHGPCALLSSSRMQILYRPTLTTWLRQQQMMYSTRTYVSSDLDISLEKPPSQLEIERRPEEGRLSRRGLHLFAPPAGPSQAKSL